MFIVPRSKVKLEAELIFHYPMSVRANGPTLRYERKQYPIPIVWWCLVPTTTLQSDMITDQKTMNIACFRHTTPRGKIRTRETTKALLFTTLPVCSTHFLAYCSSCMILSGLLSMSMVLIPTERLLSPAAAMLWLLMRPEAGPCLEMELGAVSEFVR